MRMQPKSNIQFQHDIRNARWRVWNLIHPEGLYLHMNGDSFTKDPFWAWKGTTPQAEAMKTLWAGKGLELEQSYAEKPTEKDIFGHNRLNI